MLSFVNWGEIIFISTFFLLFIFLSFQNLSNRYTNKVSVTGTKYSPINSSYRFSSPSPSTLSSHTSASPKISIKTGDTIYDLIWCPILHLYRINGKPVLWSFWDKTPLPLHIKLSLATVRCHNQDDFHLQIVSEPELSAWIGVIHPAYQYLIPAHKSDYFRGWVSANYGGMYMDPDTIGLHNLKHLFDKLDKYDVVNIDWLPDGDEMAIGIIGPMRAK